MLLLGILYEEDNEQNLAPSFFHLVTSEPPGVREMVTGHDALMSAESPIPGKVKTQNPHFLFSLSVCKVPARGTCGGRQEINGSESEDAALLTADVGCTV